MLASPREAATIAAGEVTVAAWGIAAAGIKRAELYIDDVKVNDWPPNEAPNSAQPPLPTQRNDIPSRTNFNYVWTATQGTHRLRFVIYAPNDFPCESISNVTVTA